MTPAAIYKSVRDFLIVAAIAFVAYRIYTDGKNAVRADQFKDLQHQVQEQADTVSAWHTEAANANTALAQSIARINSAPVVVHDWVRPQSSCPNSKVLPAAARAAGDTAAAGGGDQQVVGGAAGESELRDAIVADWKRLWEERLATWRAEHAQWPQP